MIPTRFKRSLMAAVVAPALAVPAAALAQVTYERPGVVHEQSQIVPGAAEMRASELIGMEVVNREGEELGEIRDLVIDTATGRVEYAALEHGGILGMGEDLFAYPMRAFAIGAEADHLVLDVSEERLENREGFNEENWPKMREDRDYWANIDRDFGIDDEDTAAAGAGPQVERQFVRASEIMDRDEVQDLVVSLEDGDVEHVIVERDNEVLEMDLDELDLS